MKDYSKAHMNQTPGFEMSVIKENVTAEKNSHSGVKSMKSEDIPQMQPFNEQPKAVA